MVRPPQAPPDKALLPGQGQEQERLRCKHKIQIHLRQHEATDQRRGVQDYFQEIPGQG